MSLIQKLKKEWLEYLLVQKGLSQKTIENYNRYLGKFISWSAVNSPSQITKDLIESYRIYLNRKIVKNRKLKTISQRYQLLTLRNFLNFLLIKKDLVVFDPLKIDLPKVEMSNPSFLNEREVKNLLSTIKKAKKNLKNLRDNAILELLFSTGLKLSELISLNKETIDFGKGEILVLDKMGKRRTIVLSPLAQKSLISYLNQRKDSDPALFIRTTKKKISDLRLSARQIERIVNYWAKKSGIFKKITPQVLRNTFCTELLKKGIDLKKVQELAGHSSIFSTLIYKKIVK